MADIGGHVALNEMAKTIAVLEVRRSTGCDDELAISAVEAVAESVLRDRAPSVLTILSLIAAAETALDFQRDTDWMRGNRVRDAVEEAAPAPSPTNDDVAAVVAAWASLAPMPTGVSREHADLFRARRTLQAVDTDPRTTVKALADLAIRVAWARRNSG